MSQALRATAARHSSLRSHFRVASPGAAPGAFLDAVVVPPEVFSLDLEVVPAPPSKDRRAAEVNRHVLVIEISLAFGSFPAIHSISLSQKDAARKLAVRPVR